MRIDQMAQISDGAQEIGSPAFCNGQRALLMNVQKSQDENTIAVIDGLNKTLAELQKQLPPGVKLTQITDGSRQIRVSVANMRQTLLEGALLTVLIVLIVFVFVFVFVFLNSWRSTVITGLTLPIALIGTFFFMNLLGSGGVCHHLVHCGGVFANWLHGRHHRQVFPRIWLDDCGGGADVDVDVDVDVCQLHA